MKKLLLASFVSALAAIILFPAAAVAVPMAADPITISLNNPNQSVAAPSSGFITLTFTGTITVGPNYAFDGATVDQPFSASNNSLGATLNSALSAFIGQSGIYSGALFDITIPAGTPPDLYAYHLFQVGLSALTVFASPIPGLASLPSGGPQPEQAREAYSVLVTNGSAVPEGGSGLLFLGFSVAGLLFARRAFLPSARRTIA